MEGSSGSLRLQIAGLLGGALTLQQFQNWLALAESEIEQSGSDAEVDLMNLVENRLAEYTGGHISAEALLGALQRDLEECSAEPSRSSALRSA